MTPDPTIEDIIHPDTLTMSMLIDAAGSLARAGRPVAAREVVERMMRLDAAAWRACTMQLDRLFADWPYLLADEVWVETPNREATGVAIGAIAGAVAWLALVAAIVRWLR